MQAIPMLTKTPSTTVQTKENAETQLRKKGDELTYPKFESDGIHRSHVKSTNVGKGTESNGQ